MTHESTEGTHKTPLADILRWLPTLAFADALPYATMFVSLVLFKRLGLSNDGVTVCTSLLFTPWLLRPFFERKVKANVPLCPLIALSETLPALLLIAIAFTLRTDTSVVGITLLLWLTAMCGVIHNVAVSHLCHKAIIGRHHTPFTYRSLGFLLAMTLCQGFLVAFAGNMEVLTRTIRYSWSLTFYILGGTFLILTLLHCVTLRKPDKEVPPAISKQVIRPARTHIWLLLLTLIPEGLLTQVGQLFLVDAHHNGGLGLSPSEYGLTQGTVAMIGLVVGFIVGLSATKRMKQCAQPYLMVLLLTLPTGFYLYLSYTMTGDILVIALCVLLHLWALGFSLSMCLRILIYLCNDLPFVCTLMSVPLILSGLFSGTLQESMGYRTFFTFILCLAPIAFLVVAITQRHSIKYQTHI